MEPKSEERGASDLDNLKTHSWQISDGMSGTTESSNENFVVIVNETHTTILWHVASNFLVVLFELNSHALTHGRVRLLSFDSDLLDDDSGSVRGSSEWLLPLSSLVSFLVTFIGPSIKRRISVPLQPIPSVLTYLLRRLLTRSLRPALIPRGFPLPIVQIRDIFINKN